MKSLASSYSIIIISCCTAKSCSGYAKLGQRSPREVIKRVLKHNAAAVILVHNHPSGEPEPSRCDIQLTKKLQELLEILDVRLLDHFIVAGTETVSMAERGLV